MGEARKSNAGVVVAGLMLLSLTVGVVAYWRFIVSDRHLRGDLKHFERVGPTLTVEGCVDATLAWGRRCQAMKSLCDASIPEMMGKCLTARSRASYCGQLGDRGKDTHYGYKECKARKVTRRAKKTCSLAYRAVAKHCESRGGEATQ